MEFFRTLIDANLSQWYWFFKAGKPVKKGNIFDLRRANFENLPPPVFFLSTGRTGTAWFADLLSKDKNFIVFHEAIPHLSIQNGFFYKLDRRPDIDEETKLNIGKEMFLAGREQFLVNSYKTNKSFLETNNQYVFFAKAMVRLFPNAKFVHLYRHPGEFVRSGLRRNWYGEGERSNLKIISPINDSNWHNYNQLQKISWLWTEVNGFIEEVKTLIPENRKMDFNFNKKSADNIRKLADFCGVNITEKHIKKQMSVRVNAQEIGNVKKYKDWSDEEKSQLKDICGDLAIKYGYEL
ncbi:MAG: sulfotransferase [Bacteroidales bacterium]|nr:sulfotransferase [Bacteroidales bacterium]